MPSSLIQEWINAILKELNLHKGKAVLCFAVVTCLVVTVGIFWPKKFEAASIVYADDQNIIKPLLAGSAEVTKVNEGDQLQIVVQRIFSDEMMKQVLVEAKLIDPAKLEDRYSTQPLIRSVAGGLKVEGAGKNHIRFSFRDGDRNKAYAIAAAVTNVFIRDTARSKREESSEAYKFINNQVTTYKEQLQTAEDRLKEFRTNNPGGSEGTGSRMGELRTSAESLTLELQIARARRDELRQQIAHEKQFIAQSYKADVYRSAMAQAQSKLDTLRLSYQETYPDIVALKQQIDDLRRAAAQAESAPQSDQDSGSSSANPVYQRLKTDLSDAEVNVKTLELKLESSRRLLSSETENTKENAEYQAQLAELTRDYTVTKKIYEDLLDRKEKARMSVALDVQGQGLNYRIKEPAVYPTAPVGLRFIHFFLLAPVVGFLLPVGLIFAYIQLDPRVRFVDRVHSALPDSVSLLIVVPHMTTQLERRSNRAEWGYLAVFFGLIMLAYIIVAVVRLSGVV